MAFYRILLRHSMLGLFIILCLGSLKASYADSLLTITRNDDQCIQVEIRIDSFSLRNFGRDQYLLIPGTSPLSTSDGFVPYIPFHFILPDLDNQSFSYKIQILDSLDIDCISPYSPYAFQRTESGYQLEKSFEADSTIPFPFWIQDRIMMSGQPIALGRIILARQIPSHHKITLYKHLKLDIRFHTQHTQSSPVTATETANLDGFVINPHTRFPGHGTETQHLRKPTQSLADDYLNACKFPIYQSGMHKITYDKAKEVIPSLDNYTFNQFKIMYGGGKMLEDDLAYPRPQLKEIATIIEDNGNLKWEQGESILFYAESITRSEYSPYPYGISSIFDDQNQYWLMLVPTGTRQSIPTITIPSTALSRPLLTGREYIYKEQNDILDDNNSSTDTRSGTKWYWSALSELKGKDFSVTFQVDEPSADTAQCWLITSAGAARNVSITLNGQLLNANSSPFSIPPNRLIQGENTLYVYFNTTLSSTLYIDNISLLYRKKLTITKNSHTFWIQETSSYDGIELNLSESKIGKAFYLLELSDKYQPQRYVFPESPSGSTLRVPLYPARSYLFYWCQTDQITEISKLSLVNWQNLQSTQNEATYLIITHQDFRTEAERLAQFYSSRDGITVKVIDIDDVYNEFSYGLHDVLAIRDFLYYARENWNQQTEKTEYALLFGDGHWDYRGKYADASPLKIPTFESSYWVSDGYVMSDDFFGYFLDADQKTMNRNYPQIAIGRIPAQTLKEARTTIDKIITFQTRNNDDYWRQRLIISADDEFNIQYPNSPEPIHTINTETLIVPKLPGFALLNKIYLMNYSTVTKNQARVDLKRSLNEGSLLFNWVGHGSWERLAHETIFQGSEDIPQLTNLNRYFLFYAAACDVGRYDMLNGYSLAERILLQPQAGAIAAVSATRSTYSGPNEILNGFFLSYALNQNYPIGKALIMAKASSSSVGNNRCYNLLGDPYLSLYNIQYQAGITSLNTDTLTAGENFTFQARVTPLSESNAQSPQGNVIVILQDAPKYVNFDLVDSVQYPGNILFKGLFKLEDNLIQGTMVMPIDMSYLKGKCELKIFQPGENETSGYYNHLYLSGRMGSTQDSLPPEINFIFDYIPATDGMSIWTSSLMIVDLYDEHGINLTGEPGHQILLTIDQDSKTRVDLTSYFQYNVNSYQEGEIQYSLSGLFLGKHTLNLRCFDNFNNLSEKNIQILVQNKKPLVLDNVFNYPNPFKSQTQFVFSTNSPGQITLEMFTLSGRRIMKLKRVAAVGQTILDWDGCDWAGDEVANGTYFYKLSLTDLDTGRTIHKTQKMVKMK